MSAASGEREILDLVWALTNNRLDEAGCSRLEQLVVTDPEKRRLYLSAIDLQAGLEWGEGSRLGCQPNAEESIPSFGLLAETFGVDFSRRQQVARTPHHPVARWLSRSPLRSISLVACVYYLLAAVLFWNTSVMPSGGRGDNSYVSKGGRDTESMATAELESASQTAHPMVARLTNGKQIRWRSSALPTRLGSILPHDQQIELVQGAAEITLPDGACVVMRSPAKFRLTMADRRGPSLAQSARSVSRQWLDQDRPRGEPPIGLRPELLSSPLVPPLFQVEGHRGRLVSRVELSCGRLSAFVPPRAVGFIVDTPTATVVDLGTEFIVDVSADGTTGVLVQTGTVDVSTTSPAEPRTTKRMVVGQYEQVKATGFVPQTAQTGSYARFLHRVPQWRGPILVEQGGMFAPGNLAFRPAARAFARNCIAGFPIHTIEHLNDGRYGNHCSWVADPTVPDSFAGIALGGRYEIESIAFGRDNGNDHANEPDLPFLDRCAGTYVVQVTTVENPTADTPESAWKTLGTITHGEQEVEIASGRFKPYLRHRYAFAPVEATGVRLVVPGAGVAIDELEVYRTELENHGGDANQ